MFFIAGITGHVGGAAARRLLGQGRSVRALARDPQKASAWSRQGVEVRQGNFNDPAALADALEGVEGAFLMIPPTLTPSPGFAEAKATIASYREALRQAPPPRLVLLSSIGSEQKSGVGLITSTHLMEQALADLPFPTALVRAGSFMENYAYGLKQAEATGFFDVFLNPTARKVPMIATQDIGAEVARLLIAGWSGKKIVEIGTPISADDLARALSQVLGRTVQARSIPREQWAATMAYQGVPAGASGPYKEMVEGINSGWIDFGVPGAERVPGTLTPVEFFAAAKSS